MASIILPGRFTRQPQYPVEIARGNPLTLGLLEAHTPYTRVYDFIGNSTPTPTSDGVGFSIKSDVAPPRISTSRLLAGRDNSTALAVFSTIGTTANASGRPFYCERSNSNGIYKFGLGATTTTAIGFVFRNDAANLINNTTTAPIDAARLIHVGAFVTNGTAERTIYCDRKFATNTSNFANTQTASNDRRICGDSQDLAVGYNGGVLGIFLWDRSLSIGELDELTDNPWQLFRPQRRVIYFDVAAASGGAANLAADAAASASASGALSVSVPLAGASISTATATGALSLSVPIAGDATATANARGGLSLSVPLSAVAAAIAAGSGDLSINVSLSGAAIAEAAAAADLTVTTSGLAGNAQAQAAASGALSIGIPLTGAALTVSSASGALTQIVPLTGSAASASLATGGLDVSVQLSGAALAQALATAGLTVEGGMSAAAAAVASATGTLTLYINLDGAAVANAVASGALASDGALAATPGWSISRQARTWSISRQARTWSISRQARTWRIAS